MVLIIMLMLSKSSAFTAGLSGWINIIQNTTKNYEDGEKISAGDTLNQNFFLRLDKSITPMLSYQIHLRTNLLDSDITDADGTTTTTYQRRLEPAVDFSLRNPTYDMIVGYRRQEQWSTAHLTNESRVTSEFYYSRFGLTPEIFPSLSFYFDRQEDFDYLTDRETDRTNNTYSLNSAYELPSRDLTLRYFLNYSRSEDKTPLNITEKTISDGFNGNYNIGYSGFYWARKVNFSVGYQGNYSRSKSRQSVTQTGSVLNKRTASVGLSGQNMDRQIELNNNSSLTNDNFSASAGINLSTVTFNHIGIFILFSRSVDRLFIYVNKNVNNETQLDNLNNWEVFKSNSNQDNSWTSVTIKRVNIAAFDIPGNIYRYEIEFLTPQDALYFKAINAKTSNIPNVEVTEIEAYGTDEIEDTDMLIDVSSSFTQGVNFNTNIRPFPKLLFAFHYSLDRLDQNPLSIMDSISGVFKNILSDSIPEENENFRSLITRNYGLATTWMTYELLTTTMRFQRNENFDNVEETDNDSNTYHLSFDYIPLPTLDANLTLIKSERFNFNEKDSTHNSFLLSVGSKLHRDVNMITDAGYTQSKSFTNDITSSSYTLHGTIDAIITRKLSGNLNYGFTRASSNDTSSDSKDALVRIDYRPGRLVNISVNFNISDSDESRTTSEGFLIDWLPLPAIRLNLNYQHSDSEPGPSTSDILSGYGIWYITKFADVRLSYGYTRSEEESVIEGYNFGTNLNCRF